MKFKKDNNLQNQEQASNKTVANMLLSKYLKGKAIQESEDVEETDPSDVVNNNDPTSTIQVNPKSYSIDKKIGMSSTSSSSSSGIKEFLKDSNVLDNELNEFITELNMNHSDDVYSTERVHSQIAPRRDPEPDDEESDDVQNENSENDYSDDFDDGADNEDENEEHSPTNQLKNIYDQLSPPFEHAYGFQLGSGSESPQTLYEITQAMHKALKAHNSANTFIKYFAGYKNLNSSEQKVVREVFSLQNDTFSKDQLYNALKKNGYVVTRTMNNKHVRYDPKKKDKETSKYNQTMTDVSKDDLYDDFINDRKSGGRKNIKIVSKGDIFENQFSTLIKKISNIVNNLLHQVSMLVNNKFSGSNYADNNTILDLYETIANNMYLVTSYNPKNVQLKKLDTDFEKLYKQVNNGIKSYQPPKASISGGKINIPDNMFVSQKVYKTNHLHLL